MLHILCADQSDLGWVVSFRAGSAVQKGEDTKMGPGQRMPAAGRAGEHLYWK